MSFIHYFVQTLFLQCEKNGENGERIDGGLTESCKFAKRKENYGKGFNDIADREAECLEQ